jgi:predicted RecA/RadA family phage recombinase
MPTATFVQEGNQLDYTPAADVAAGAVVVLNDLIGIAKSPIAANKPGALSLTGVFSFPKATGTSTAIARGKKVYWDEAAQEAKEDSETGANKYLGKTVLAAGDSDAAVNVRLDP